MNARDIIIKPIITEKTMTGVVSDKKYTFKVDKKATKIDIANAVEEAFGVKVSKVNTVNVRGRLRRQGRYSFMEKGLCYSYRRQQNNRIL